MTGRTASASFLPVAVFLAAVVIVPFGWLAAQAWVGVGGAAGAAVVWSNPITIVAAENSALQGLLSALVAGAVGYPVGIVLGRYDFPGRGALRASLLVPFLLPSLVVVLGVRDLFGSAESGGAVPGLSALGHGLPGIVAVNVYFNAAIVALLTASAVEGAPREQEEAVAVLGGSPLRVFRQVWGPLSALGAAAGMTLTFLLSALGFAAPLLVCGASCFTLENRVWELAILLGEPSAAGVVALGTVALLAAPTVLYLVLLRASRRRSSRRVAGPRPLPRGQPLAWAGLLYTAVFFAALAALIVEVLVRSAAPVRAGPWGAGYGQLFGPSVTARIGLATTAAAGNSLFFAASAALLTLLLAISCAFAQRRTGARSLAADLLLFVPLLISPVLLAFGLATLLRPFVGVDGVWGLILLSQSALALPFALQSLRLSLDRLPPGPYEAAQLLGSGPFSAYLDAEVPRIRSGLIGASLFAFAIGLGEFTATFFLVLPPFTTLPVELELLDTQRQFAAAGALAGVLVLLSLGVFLATEFGGRRVEL